MRPSERAEYDSSPNEAQRHVAIPSSFPPLMRSRWLFNNCAIFGVRSASFARFGEWPFLRLRRHPRMPALPQNRSNARARRLASGPHAGSRPTTRTRLVRPPLNCNTLTHPSVARKGPQSEVAMRLGGQGHHAGETPANPRLLVPIWYLEAIRLRLERFLISLDH